MSSSMAQLNQEQVPSIRSEEIQLIGKDWLNDF